MLDTGQSFAFRLFPSQLTCFTSLDDVEYFSSKAAAVTVRSFLKTIYIISIRFCLLHCPFPHPDIVTLPLTPDRFTLLPQMCRIYVD
jgi:hypothetical protein